MKFVRVGAIVSRLLPLSIRLSASAKEPFVGCLPANFAFTRADVCKSNSFNNRELFRPERL